MVLFVKPKKAYEMRISDWSSDVCSSDLIVRGLHGADGFGREIGHRPVDHGFCRNQPAGRVAERHGRRLVEGDIGGAAVVDGAVVLPGDALVLGIDHEAAAGGLVGGGPAGSGRASGRVRGSKYGSITGHARR